MNSPRISAPSSWMAAGQHILNHLGEWSQRASERRRMALLPHSYLDDAGMVPAQFSSDLPGGEGPFVQYGARHFAHSI